MAIPPRLDQVVDKDRRFYVSTPSSVYLALQDEAIKRGTDVWTLGGSVLVMWIAAGCPDSLKTHADPSSPAPSPSSSVAEPKDPGA